MANIKTLYSLARLQDLFRPSLLNRWGETTLCGCPGYFLTVGRPVLQICANFSSPSIQIERLILLLLLSRSVTLAIYRQSTLTVLINNLFFSFCLSSGLRGN